MKRVIVGHIRKEDKTRKFECPNHGILNVMPFNDGQENAKHYSSGWEGGVIANPVGFAHGPGQLTEGTRIHSLSRLRYFGMHI